MTFDLREHGVSVVLLDVEGTTTPMAFVYDVLFPYARARLSAYLRAHASEDALRDVLATLRVEWQEDARTGQEPPDWAIAGLCREVERSIVIAGGVTTANFPQVARNFRRSSLASFAGGLVSSVMLTPITDLSTAIQI